MSNISRQAYADMFGPTVGDKVRLADTELWIEVEDDLTTYGEEVKFGGVFDDHRLATKTQMFARAVVARQSKNLSYRELAFSKSFEQGFAYGARCAQYGNIPAFRHGG